MASLVAYFKQGGGPGFGDQERRDGGKNFGKELRKITGINPRDEIYEVIQDQLGDNKFKFRWEFIDEAGNRDHLLVEDVETQGNEKIVLTLEKKMGADARAILRIRADRRENFRKKNNAIKDRTFHMNVVIPEVGELNGFQYLQSISADVLSINDQTDGANYLTAFKLMSRCS